ncbi:complex I intermediate-associated protein 30-domain-containing protein [Clohesyomyces aquaticus]|uniref:Complex I intermediate-associated protein 30-domain-containing protein n=1 Tax=Clohesyomyces aquaticus TaxID=1231657 RepID=A0A1Y1ZUP2_9PLEO|nr:complex I intermediate-associated protein 30-domain-containing protein [Clohesyomyces aquaticus]
MGNEHELTLFGGDEPWKQADWTASDDRVRGGKSQSYLSPSSSGARFHGTLDIKTLGGAGFASQRTTSASTSWDLSAYDGIKIELGKWDRKRYTFILKDELLPQDPTNGRERATISYEYDFTPEIESCAEWNASFVWIPWKSLKPTYRGREKKDAPRFDNKTVKRISVMMRSFFGDQEGDFSLTLKSIKAVKIPHDEEKGLVSGSEKQDSVAQQGQDVRLPMTPDNFYVA